jgi:hypothetical protein
MGVKLVCHLKGRIQIQVFDSTVLRRIFGHEVTGGWRKLHNEELNNL